MITFISLLSDMPNLKSLSDCPVSRLCHITALCHIPYSGLLWWWKSGGFGLSPPYFPRSKISPAIIEPADSAFWVSGSMGHDTLHVAFNMLNKYI